MKKRNLTQMQLSELSGVRQAAISELYRNARQEINLIMLAKLATAMNIRDISELLQFVDENKGD
ncbi:helix-turn-helix transcriptional regulator [Paenibacillus sp. KACC 21273]|uniref:helix-turn-helix domain-containing protein n=1 Tax=Paenibacillus sp. KACC 21273 TaxID=3025665 RepID=UPI0023661E64|nr:helix-turn-helix transcriptional regulator [Paenibacillus sp. KACC 21273]WDF52462.1 helix-turn-helix transcriptional regulator [Paenibacillus sp. KACC 21273]